MTMDHSQVRVGMAVVGTDAQRVGLVKEILDGAVLVDRRLHRDIYVPLHAMEAVGGDQLVLTIPAAAVDDMDWPEPPIPGEPGAGVGGAGLAPPLPE